MPKLDEFRFDGITIPVEITNGPDRPLLFLPGFGVHPLNYREAATELGHHFTVIMPDLSFRTHARLPLSVASYVALVDALADRHAPQAPRTGHSFGGLLALLGSTPAVALAPMVPISSGWPTKIGRAALLQLREYAGFEGRRGIHWAFHIGAEYVRTAAFRPRCLFPAVSEMLRGIPDELLPTAPRAVLVLARHDRLYKRSEYDAYLRRARIERFDTRYVGHGHDWPVTHPGLVRHEVLAALGAE